ncbi:MAG: hypothetical protein IPJ32_14285 [Sphingobacteriaceae bacterium]|nr:hypothetical protein [Sphingobacteriaceae bacterium]
MRDLKYRIEPFGSSKCIIYIENLEPIRIEFISEIPYVFIRGIGYKVEGKEVVEIFDRYFIKDTRFLAMAIYNEYIDK